MDSCPSYITPAVAATGLLSALLRIDAGALSLSLFPAPLSQSVCVCVCVCVCVLSLSLAVCAQPVPCHPCMHAPGLYSVSLCAQDCMP